MKNLLVFLIFFSFCIMLMNCGGGKQAAKINYEDGISEIDDPFMDLQSMVNQITQNGGIAAVGNGSSKRMEVAKDKARSDGQAKLAESFQIKVQGLKESFLEEVGNGEKTEINEAFSSVSKVVTNQVLKGAIMKDSKLLTNKKTKQYMSGMVMAIEPETFSNTLLKEMENSQPKLYERFRASEAMKRLNEEMEKYEAQQTTK